METPYREAARRRARKEKALKAGQKQQNELDELRKRREEVRARRAAAEARRRQAAAGAHPARPRRPAGGKGNARPAGAAGPAGTGSAAAPKPGSSKSFADPRQVDTTTVCPHCKTKLVRVVCLQKPVLACVQCRGVSVSGDVVKQFASQGGWFSQLEPAVSHFARRQRPR